MDPGYREDFDTQEGRGVTCANVKSFGYSLCRPEFRKAWILSGTWHTFIVEGSRVVRFWLNTLVFLTFSPMFLMASFICQSNMQDSLRIIWGYCVLSYSLNQIVSWVVIFWLNTLVFWSFVVFDGLIYLSVTSLICKIVLELFWLFSVAPSMNMCIFLCMDPP